MVLTKVKEDKLANDEFTVEDIAKIVGDGTNTEVIIFRLLVMQFILQFMEIVKYIIDNSKIQN